MRRWIWILPASFLFGVWLSVTFVNPYDSSLTLSYLVFQLGGARGDILLEFNMLDLLEFSLRLVPNLVFQAMLEPPSTVITALQACTFFPEFPSV